MKALIQIDPPQIVQVYADLPHALALPDGSRVEGATTGWTNGSFSLIEVEPFQVPAGRVTTGAPSYALADGDVTESYETAPDPALNVIDAATFMARTTDQEMAAVEAASVQNVQIARWLETLRSEGKIDVSMPEAQAAKAGLVGAGLLTQDRADVIFAGRTP